MRKIGSFSNYNKFGQSDNDFPSVILYQFQKSMANSFITSETVQPRHICLASKPCELAFRIIANVLFRLLNRRFQVTLAEKVFANSTIRMCSESVCIIFNSARKQLFHLVDKAGGKMLLGAAVDLFIELIPGRI